MEMYDTMTDNWAGEYEARPPARMKPRLRLESCEVGDAARWLGCGSAVYRVRITLATGHSWTPWQPTISWAWRDARRKLRALDMLR